MTKFNESEMTHRCFLFCNVPGERIVCMHPFAMEIAAIAPKWPLWLLLSYAVTSYANVLTNTKVAPHSPPSQCNNLVREFITTAS